MRIAVADDSEFFRNSLAALLEKMGVEITAEVGTGPELLAAIASDVPDVAVIDIRMPPSGADEGITAAVELRSLYPRLGIFMLSQYVQASYASTLLAKVPAGVGYWDKQNVAETSVLMDDLERVAAGGTAIDPAVIQSLLPQQQRPPSALEVLTERELEVLRCMAEGRSNTGIASKLLMSPKTVETNVSRIFRKLELDKNVSDNSRVSAVLTYLRWAAVEG
jgi:DNA-binding NarL/FixJ family response regulator